MGVEFFKLTFWMTFSEISFLTMGVKKVTEEKVLFSYAKMNIH